MNRFYTGNAYPFLYGISTGLVIRFIIIYIINYLFFGKCMKIYKSGISKGDFAALE